MDYEEYVLLNIIKVSIQIWKKSKVNINVYWYYQLQLIIITTALKEHF